MLLCFRANYPISVIKEVFLFFRAGIILNLGFMGSIKEQVYLEKLNQLKNQLQMLVAGTHVDYVNRLKALKKEHGDALAFTKLCRQLEIDRIERECETEKTAALREFEEKRAELRETLTTELEERRRQVEHEYQTMELTSDNVEAKPMKTRNLRRRYNDPAPVNDNKRARKASPTLNLTLSSLDIAEDLKLISAATANLPLCVSGPDGGSVSATTSNMSLRRDRSPPEGHASGNASSTTLIGTDTISDTFAGTTDVTIEDGKLIYQKKCYTRGQPVYVETPDSVRMAAVVQTVGARDLTLRLSNGKRMNVTLAQLQQGKCVLWRRPA